MANPSVFVKAIEVTLDEYRNANHRNPMLDVSIWHSLKYWYQDEDVEMTATPEECFDRIIADGWKPDMGEHFYGIDFETVDEAVLTYLIDNALVVRDES